MRIEKAYKTASRLKWKCLFGIGFYQLCSVFYGTFVAVLWTMP